MPAELPTCELQHANDAAGQLIFRSLSFAQFIFLGRLTAMEATKLTERLIRYVVFKVIFCGALIMPDIYDIVLWMAW